MLPSPSELLEIISSEEKCEKVFSQFSFVKEARSVQEELLEGNRCLARNILFFYFVRFEYN